MNKAINHFNNNNSRTQKTEKDKIAETTARSAALSG